MLVVGIERVWKVAASGGAAAAALLLLTLLSSTPASAQTAAAAPEVPFAGNRPPQQTARFDGRLDVDERFELFQDARWPLPSMAWSFSALGVASITSAILLDASAGGRLEGMKSCSPTCAQEHVDGIQRTLRLSRMAGSIGVLSFATAAWLALAESPADAFASGRSAPRLRVFGGSGGTRVLLTTTFDETRLLEGQNPLVR